MEKKYPNQLVVIGVHTPKFDHEKALEVIRRAMLRYGLHHPVINDADRKIWTAYNVQSWPSLVLIDPEGYFAGGLAKEHVFEQFDKAITQMIRVHRAKGTLVEGPSRFHAAAADKNTNVLSFPGKVLADAPGKRLFIADSTNNRIVITDLTGKKIAIAGTGVEGKADGAFAKATFNEPQGMALYGNTLYVADRKNHLIRALDLKAQTVKTVAGTGRQSAFPPSKAAQAGGNPRTIPLNSPWDLLVVGKSLYIAMAGHHQIWALRLQTPPWLGLVAGNSNENLKDGPRLVSEFAQPSGLTSDGQNLYVADSESSSIRALPLSGAPVRTLVGKGLFDFGDLDGIGPQVRLQHPLAVLFHKGKLYVADSYNDKIKVLDPQTHACRTFVSGTKEEPLFSEPSGLSYANGKLYVADTNNNRIQVVDIGTREVSTLALSGVDAPKRTAR